MQDSLSEQTEELIPVVSDESSAAEDASSKSFVTRCSNIRAHPVTVILIALVAYVAGLISGVYWQFPWDGITSPICHNATGE